MDAARDTIIKDDVSEVEWRDFEDHVEMLEPDALAAIAARLGSGQQATWQDYAKEFSEYSWDQFIEAYEHCTAKRY
jgi:hypothetical protein